MNVTRNAGIDKSRAVCFSGYRPDKFNFPLDDGSLEYNCLLSTINHAVFRCVEDGCTTFLCGMAKGFDIICGEAAARLMDNNKAWKGVKLIAVLPYEKHGRWGGEWGKRHSGLLARADGVEVMRGGYTKTCYHERNRFMVDNSSRLICYWDGQLGGTAHSVYYARLKNLSVINLANEFE